MIIHSALPLFIQHNSPGETDSFILECAEDCGFTDMCEVEGRGDEDYDTSRPAILEFAARLLRRQRILERYILLTSQSYMRFHIGLEGALRAIAVPFEMIRPRYDEAGADGRGYMLAKDLYWVMATGDDERAERIRRDGSTFISCIMQFLLDDIVKYDPDFQDMRDADAAREQRDRDRAAELRAERERVTLRHAMTTPPVTTPPVTHHGAEIEGGLQNLRYTK